MSGGGTMTLLPVPPADDEEAPCPLRVVAWADPVIDRLGYDPRSAYVEHFWLPVLGPTATWLLRRLVIKLDVYDAVDVDRAEIALSIGVGGREGRNSPFGRAVGRCVSFEVARWRGRDEIAVRTHLPPLPRRLLIRLPVALQELHREWTDLDRANSPLEQQRGKARRLALGYLDVVGRSEGAEAVEVQLVRHGIHPALANEATRWAARHVAET